MAPRHTPSTQGWSHSKSKWEWAALNTISLQASKALSILQKLLQFEKRCKEQDRKHIGPKHMLSFLPWKERKKETINPSTRKTTTEDNSSYLFHFHDFFFFFFFFFFFNWKKVEEERVKKNPSPDTNTTTTTTQSGYAKRQKRMQKMLTFSEEALEHTQQWEPASSYR